MYNSMIPLREPITDKSKDMRYSNISEVIADVNNLPEDFVSHMPEYMEVLAKIACTKAPLTYEGLERESGYSYYPSSVFDAIAKVCKTKFPNYEAIFDENNNLKPGLYEDNGPLYSLLPLSHSAFHIDMLTERTPINTYVEEHYGIDIYAIRIMNAGEYNGMIASCEEYLKIVSNTDTETK